MPRSLEKALKKQAKDAKAAKAEMEPAQWVYDNGRIPTSKQ